MIKDEITQLLERYRDVFAVNPSEMLDKGSGVIEYKLYLDLNHKSVIQK